MRAEFCIFESNAPGLKANFYEPYVAKPIPAYGFFFFFFFFDVLKLRSQKEKKRTIPWLNR